MKSYMSGDVRTYGRVFALAILSASVANAAAINTLGFSVGASLHASLQNPDPTAIELDVTDGFMAESSAAITGAAVAFLRHSGPTASNVVPASMEIYRPMDFSIAGRSIPELSSAGVLLLGLLLFVVGLSDRRIRKRHRSK